MLRGYIAVALCGTLMHLEAPKKLPTFFFLRRKACQSERMVRVAGAELE